MLFNSEPYLFFLPIVVLVNWVLPRRFRPFWLLLASYYFYSFWSAPFLLLVVGLTVINFVIGTRQARLLPRSRSLLVAALVVNIGALAIFKYLGLLDQSADALATLLGLSWGAPAVHIILPLGLSFFTFEFLHYQVDLFRGGVAIHNPINFALFPAFFPTQIAGPIKRYQDFNAQVEKHPRFDPVLCFEGVQLIARGLFKKVVLADTMAPIVAIVFGNPAAATGLDGWTALLAFYLQLYLDFSGYTDIGRGSAQLLGYRIPINFNAPYLATSIQEFWRRWHMSLSFWLRDYLYIPLGGSRRSPGRVRLNLMITMALGGLWHGAAWHFLMWGVGYGGALNIERWWRARMAGRLKLSPALVIGGGWIATQLTWLVLLLVFRASGLDVAAILGW
ncbi:MAG: MBOAT family protein, partial [Candidatus Dormibacteraeota bacterium]|nr:MBOAT family protein [Candidatus Dormibacteraeota bacterium]